MLKTVLSALLLISVCGVAYATHPPSSLDQQCQECHDHVVTGAHATVPCQQCHGETGDIAMPTAIANRAEGCVGCHDQADHIFDHAMATRTAEQQFCQRSWSKGDPQFFERNCTGCHVANCLDCHGDGHALELPDTETCSSCHNGYFVGWDFSGRAPREDSVRYQRGAQNHDQYYLKMRPDVHLEAGMDCGDCHSMASLQAGQVVAKGCVDCHDPDPTVIEHSVAAHLENMECVSCHAAWSAQEYGTFYIHTINSSNRNYFRVQQNDGDYIKSSYLKRQDSPILGLNQQGRVSPIRPQFIAYYSEMENNLPVGAENRLLAAEWKAYTPHTIRRGTVMCDACHNEPRRFMLQPKEKRIYRPDRDGLGLSSFWDREGQRMVNGMFYPEQRFQRMSRRDRVYAELYVRKWKNFLKKDATSSATR